MKKLFIPLALLLVVSFSCKKENMFDIVKTTGKIVTQDRDVKNFTCIYFAVGTSPNKVDTSPS